MHFKRWFQLEAEEFKSKVQEILGTEINFDGHVNLVIKNVDEARKISLLEWIKSCKEGTIRPEPCKKFRQLMAFIYKSNDNRIRGILTKEKNSYFIELFLDKHKYYDQKRVYLGL